jgi:hypothetical protein
VDEPAISSDETITPPAMAPAPVGAAGREPRAPWASAISLAEAGLLTDVGIVFDLAWIYIPILGMAFIPLIPTPFVILYLRRGARITLFAACVAGFLMTVLVGPHYGWRLTLEALIGMALGWAMRRHWSPARTIILGLFVNATVAYVAAFGAVYALGLPLQDLYLELRNMLIGVGWLLDTSATLLRAQHAWLSVRPFFATVGHFTLAYWIPMFFLYIAALAFPTVLLYYSVASTTAYALGHDVRPFPPPWVWRVLQVAGLILSPFTWLANTLWRLVTAPLWGPVWVARALARRRRERRLHSELAATAGAEARVTQVAASAASIAPLDEDATPTEVPTAACDWAPLEAAARGREASER